MKTRIRLKVSPQLDLTLPAPPPVPAPATPRRRPVRPCSRERAAWWIRQMYRVIDEGSDFRATGVR